jgi:hypothetical protein
MSTLTAGSPSTLRGFLALALASLKAIKQPQLRLAALFGLTVTTATILIFILPITRVYRTPLWQVFAQSLLVDQIKAIVLLAAVVIADAAVEGGARRGRAYVIAALVGCTIGIAVTEPVQWLWRDGSSCPPSRPWTCAPLAYWYWPMFQLTHWLLLGGCGVFLYADARAARRTAALLRASELDRLRRSKQALESRLQAMQARVEPRFLFNTLAQVEQLYRDDPPLAARMLDELIAYLRAAMPAMRDTASTVGQEVDLVRAYLGIVRMRLGNRLAFDLDVPADARSARMPPMMLLPLVDHAVVNGLEQGRADGRLDLNVEVVQGRLRLVLRDSGAGFLPDTACAALPEIKDRLRALYGDAAELRLAALDRGTSAVLDLPMDETRAGTEEEA